MLSVQETADKLGITPQAIYKKINNQLVNELKPFIRDVKRGKRTVKMIDSNGVDIIKNSLEQPVEQLPSEPDANGSQLLLNLLNETTTILQGQLTSKDAQLVVKDQQIKEMSISMEKQLEIKDQQIIELNERLKEAQELNKNNQILLHRQQDQPKMIEDKEKKFSFKNFFSKNV